MTKDQFESWHETHFEVVSAIILDAEREEASPLITSVMEEYGTGGLYELAKSLTDEFEKLNASREWDGEWLDELEEFLNKKFNEV